MSTFTIVASRGSGNPCTPDFIIGQPFNIDFTTDEPGGVIRWAVYFGGCTPENQVSNGTEFTDPFAPTEFITPFSTGEYFYSGTLADIHGTIVYTSPCLSLCTVVDKTEPVLTLTTSTPEILLHETADVTVHIDGDHPSGGGVNADWAPSNPRLDCEDPISYATEWGITAGFDMSGDAPIGRMLNECGIWAFSFNYGGDACNKPAVTGCEDLVEVFCDLPTTADLTTTATPDIGTVGDTFQDSAELLHAYRPTGSITFLVYGPDDPDCSSPVYAETIDVGGHSGSYGTVDGFVPTEPGEYRWRAFYSGDVNNDALATACDEEPFTVTAAEAPVLTTTPSGDSTLGGDPMSDSAHIESTTGHPVTGTITFELRGPDDCDPAAVVATEDVTVDAGDGDYSNTPADPPDMPGTYQWVATYSGDTDNAPTESPCGDEPVDVTDPDDTHIYHPVIRTAPNKPKIRLGQPTFDVATMTGGNFPTGNLIFKLYGPDDDKTGMTPVCSEAKLVFTSPMVPVPGHNGTFTGPSFVPTKSGWYHWVVSYDGDAHNTATDTGCADPTEKVKVVPHGQVWVARAGW